MNKEPITVTGLEKLKEIEDFWVENSFKISDQELEKIVNN